MEIENPWYDKRNPSSQKQLKLRGLIEKYKGFEIHLYIASVVIVKDGKAVAQTVTANGFKRCLKNKAWAEGQGLEWDNG